MSPRAIIQSFPLSSYFVLAYAISMISLIVLGPPSLAPGGQRNILSLVLFPVMVIWVGAAGLALTALGTGHKGIGELRSRMGRWRTSFGWYAAATLIPPAAILLVLAVLTRLVSPAFTPNLYPLGVTFGIVAGFFEEIGWSGYAYPRLRARFGPLPGAIVLGVMWGLWHLPVVDSLGVASPHGSAWPAFFAAFVALVAGLRVLICWIYNHTNSVLLAQIMHTSFTGFLVVLGALAVSPSQEALWYALDAGVLWVVAAVVVARGGFRCHGASTARAEPSQR
ncbi:MAG: lysostaphin resistance A-like protein [Chloroflexota bacterium]